MDREHSKAALAIFTTFFIALTIGIIFSLKILLWPILVGFFIAFILDPVVDHMEAKGLNRVLVIGLLFFIISVFILFVAFYFLPPLIGQVKKMIKDLPAYVELMKSQLSVLVETLQKRFPQVDWIRLYENNINKASEQGLNSLRSGPKVFTNLMGIIASAVIVPFVIFFLLKDGTGIKKQMIGLIPNRYFEMALTLFYKVKQQIFKYLQGTLLDCSIIAVLYIIGYGIIQVKYFVFLGIFAGVCNLVPYIGPWLAGGAAVIFMFIDPHAVFPWWSAVIVVGIVQFIENNIIYPVVLGKSVNLHPLVIMFGLFVGGKVAGVVGMIVAVPAMAVLKVIAEELYKGLKQYSVI